MVREPQELNEVEQAKLRLRAAAAPPVGGRPNKALRIAAGLIPRALIGLQHGRASAQRRKSAPRQGRASNKLPLAFLAGTAVAMLATGMMRRRSAKKRLSRRADY